MAAREKEILVMQLFALRAAVDAMLTVLEIHVEDGSDIGPACMHPLDRRKDESVMGGPERWQCQVCGYGYDESKSESA